MASRADANAHLKSLLCIACLVVLAPPRAALAQAAPACATSCTTVATDTATEDDRKRLASALDSVLVDLRACLGRVGAETINPAILLHFGRDGSIASAKVDVGGYEDLPCVHQATQRPLTARTSSETTLRCENRCGARPASAPPAPTSQAAPSSSPVREEPIAEREVARDEREEPIDDDRRPADDPFRRFALTLNPLSLAVLRVGLNVEVLPAPHHSIIVNPFGQFISIGSETSGGKASYSNYGGELGYRFYTGTRSANGFFVGPFVTVLALNVTTVMNAQGTRNEVSANSFVYGGGLDVGGQHVFKFGLVIGGGLGFTYLSSSTTTTVTSSTVKFDGVLPRILFTLGYAF